LDAAFDIRRESIRLDREKPYVELIDGLEIPKLSPMTRHGLLQSEMIAIFRRHFGDRGIVGPEIRVWLETHPPTSLVPDVAFISFERMDGLSPDDAERPPFAPDVVVEVRPPADRERNVARKIELYLTHGAKLVLDVKPGQRKIVAYDGTSTRVFGSGETFAHEAAAELTFAVDAYFDSPRYRRRDGTER